MVWLAAFFDLTQTFLLVETSEAGLDDKTAWAEARLAVAVIRGLLLDLLATGDRDGVTEAFERYLQHTDSIYTLRANQPAQPSSSHDQPQRATTAVTRRRSGGQTRQGPEMATLRGHRRPPNAI